MNYNTLPGDRIHLPAPPSVHAVIAIALALTAIFLYTRDKYPIEASSLLILIAILLWFELYPIYYEGARVRAGAFLSGFGNEALISITALMILARSLETTRALQSVGHVLAELWKIRPRLAFLATLLTVATLSMFLNNTPVVAAMLPLLVAVSLQAKIAPSRVLMPVGFATIIGGMATTIGTSTNLLVVAVATDLGMREMQMFDFALPVFIVGGIAIIYLWLIAPQLLPERKPPLSDVALRVFESRLRINEDSPAEGRTLAELRALTKGRMRVGRIARGELSLMKLPSMSVKAGDFLHIADTLERLKEFERALGATLLAVDADSVVAVEPPPASDEQLVEVVVTEGSILDQRTLDSTRLPSTYGLVPIALHRPGRRAGDARSHVDKRVLHAGDIVLLQGAASGLERLKRSGQVLLLDGRVDLPQPAKASIAVVIMAGVVVLAAFGFMRISIAAVLGVALMLATRCLTWKDVIGALDRRIILVIVASLALGLTLMATGAAAYIAQLYVAATGALPVSVALSGLILIMALLTEVVTNNAVAVLGTPIAIGVAQQLGAPVEPFVLGVLYGANMSYMTPVGYQTNLLVMSAGGYRFSDFLRAGVPLQIIMWLGMSIVLPLVYDL
jgi:di/tricarboxylate transporter